MNSGQLSFPNQLELISFHSLNTSLTIQEQIRHDGNILVLKLTVPCSFSYLPIEHIRLIATDSFHEIHSKAQQS